jgi:hypothetical protein
MADTVYACPMHPEVQSRESGKCPKCGMKLEPKATAPKPVPRSRSARHAPARP